MHNQIDYFTSRSIFCYSTWNWYGLFIIEFVHVHHGVLYYSNIISFYFSISNCLYFFNFIDGGKSIPDDYSKLVFYCLSELIYSTYYIIFCVVLNTVGEEVFATSFVNLLAKVSIYIRFLCRYLQLIWSIII